VRSMVSMTSQARRMQPRPMVVRKLAIYGPSVELGCDVADLEPQIARALGQFAVEELPGEMGVVRGCVRRYNETEVLRRLPVMAQPLHRHGELTEIYSHEERFWTIDDRWGMCEINLLRGQWQSWVLKQPKLDSVRLCDAAVMWPLAQLLKHKGMHLIRAASVVRGPFAALMLSPFGLGAELAMLMAAGFKLIGQRWTLAREESEQIELLSMPGVVERQASAPFGQVVSEWEDLTTHAPHLSQRHGFCSAVMVTEAARRARSALTMLELEDAAELLRRAWPVPELHPNRRHGQFPARLAQLCPSFRLQLSREPRDIVMLFDSLQVGAAS
jgi:hypothetical protein